MANYWPDFWSDVRGAIAGVWPDIGANFRAVQAERVDFQRLIQSAQMADEYVVTQMSARQDSEWGGITWTAYRCQVRVHYIARSGIPAASGDMAAYIEAKLKLLQDALQVPDAGFTVMQVLDTGFEVDVTESNAVNASMLESNLPFSGGALAFEAIVGEMPD